jgi:DMSO/TMAO reductase YedYZ molybdopterin-dependent catalytic subunit
VAIGALLVHVAVKWPLVREAYREPVETTSARGTLSRRALLRSTWAATGVALLAVAGGTVPWLRRVSVLAVHDVARTTGVPVNKTARARGVVAAATDPSYALVVRHGAREVRLGRAELRAMPQSTARLPIACVEGWSAAGTWTGVRLRHLLDLVDVPAGSTVRVVSLQTRGGFASSEVRGNLADDAQTLVALELDGEPLALDHGYPCRLIAPDRPGVLQTKWLSRIEVVT